jgi:hypothetical protein
MMPSNRILASPLRQDQSCVSRCLEVLKKTRTVAVAALALSGIDLPLFLPFSIQQNSHCPAHMFFFPSLFPVRPTPKF